MLDIEDFVLLIGCVFLAAFVMAIKRSCDVQQPTQQESPQQRQRAALAALAALVPAAPDQAAARPVVVLPYFPYAQARASETLVCAICLEALRHGELCSEVPACGHVFHADCVGAWARSKGSCPLCRVRIAPGSDGVAVADDMV